jgi:EmrB/QacA subfamily drug resistance transporter
MRGDHPVSTAVADTEPKSRRQVLVALSGLLVALFIATLSSTVVSTALPKIISSLDGSQTQYTWVITAILLTTSATTPIWGKLADLFSKKALVQAAVIVFVVGSLAAGLSQTAGQLIAARAVQGIGVGGVQALVQIALAALIPPRERGKYNGYLSSVTATSTIGGPLLGGVLVDTSWLGWRWCFLIGIPLAGVAIVLFHRTLDLPTVRRDEVKIDYLGATLITAGVSLLLIWISFVDDAFAWGSWQTATMLGGALVLLAFAVWVEKRVEEPLIPPRVIAQRTTALAIVGSLAAGTAMFGSAVFLGQYFQLSRGYSATASGLLTIPMMGGILVSSIVGGRLMSRIGKIKPFLVTGAVFLTVGFAGLSTTDQDTSMVVLAVSMLFAGLGVGLTTQNFVLVVQNTVPLRDLGAASSTIAFFRALGGTIGVTVLGAVLARQVSGSTAGDMRAAYGEATGHIFLICAIVSAVAILAALLLKPVGLRTSLDVPDAAQPVTTPAPPTTREDSRS